jgi:MSHA pilin protein MshC
VSATARNRGHSPLLPHRPAPGFTIVELIGIIAIAGIIMAVAAPRFMNANTFEARGYTDAAKGFFRYAQKLAVARHATLYVQISASAITLCTAASAPCSGANRITGPDGEASYQLNVPNGVSQTGSSSTLSFDAQGRPSSAFTLTIASTGNADRILNVAEETGYVH